MAVIMGQVALVRTHGFVAWAIRVITNSPYNHMVVGTAAGDTVSPEHEGVIRRRVTYWQPDRIVWSRFAETELQHWQVADFAEDQLGKKYNWGSDFWIFIALITKRHTPKWIEARLNSGSRWQCAQLADAALRAGGVPVFTDGRSPGAVFPGSYIHLFRERGWL